MSLFGKDDNQDSAVMPEEESSFTWPPEEAEPVEPEPEVASEPEPEPEYLTLEETEVATPEAEAASVGLYGKFRVERSDGRDRPGGDKADAEYFVLDYVNDPHARIAVRAYIDSLKGSGDEPQLAADLSSALGKTRRLHQSKRG